MKKILYILPVLAIVSCSEQTKTIDYAIFSGKIENPASHKLTVTGSNDFKQELEVAEDGSFSDTLKGLVTGYYGFFDGREYSKMYLQPGFNINLTMNTEEFDESIKYTGTGAAENNYMAQEMLLNEKHMEDSKAIYSLPEQEFLEKVASFAKEKNDLLVADKTISADFVNTQKSAIEYNGLSLIQDYEPAYKYYTKDTSYKPSETLLKKFDIIDFDNETAYKLHDSYKDLVASEFHFPFEDSVKAVALIAELSGLKSKFIKADLADMLLLRSMNIRNQNLDILYNGLKQVSADSSFTAELDAKYEKLNKLKPGHVSPQFSFQNIDGEMVNLADLAGKAVYIDVWATWCGPCKREIPSLKTLEEEYRGKDIEFVSISVDKEKDKEKWEKMVADKELKGIQLFADKDWSSDFVQAYAIHGIPRFILVDKEGNIVSADAPRPSSGEAVKTLFEEIGV